MMKNSELEKINNRVEELFIKWKSLQPLKKEYQEKFDRKVWLDWNYHSNHIEGNTLTYSETKALLNEGKEEGIHPPRDYKEMKAHDLAIDKVRELAQDKERRINEVVIRDLNQIILKEPFWKEAVTADGQKAKKKIIPGQYKTQPNHVITEEGKIFKFVEPHDVPIKMQELVEWFRGEMEHSTLSIASFIAELHHRFIVIHPFDDGNGRIARLWINYVLLKGGYPTLVIKTEDKRNYFAALQRADDGDMDVFAVYLGKVLISWLELGIKAGKGEDISEPSDVDKEVELFIKERAFKMLENEEFFRPICVNLKSLQEDIVEPFKNKFSHFNRLFESVEESEYGGIDFLSTPTICIERNRRVSHSLKTTELLYSNYMNQLGEVCEKSFDMSAKLLLELNEHTFKIEIINSCVPEFTGGSNSVKKEIHYDHDESLTERDINDLIAKGKKGFFELIKIITAKDNGDKE